MHTVFPLLVSVKPSDDELACSKHAEDSMTETNQGSNACILLVFLTYTLKCLYIYIYIYRSADKSLARPGRKQANVSVIMALISLGALPCRKRSLMTARVSMLLKSSSYLPRFRACFFPSRAKDLSAPRYICWFYLHIETVQYMITDNSHISSATKKESVK